MKISIAFICVIISGVIPAHSQISSDSIKSRLVSDWIRIHGSVKEYIDAMPDEGINFKPTTDARSFAEAMLHIAQANFNMSSAASGLTNPYDYMKSKKSIESMDQYKTKVALRGIMDESFDYTINAIRSVPAGKMHEAFVWFKRRVTPDLIFRKALEHTVFLQGQTTIYLKLKGVKVPPERMY